MNNYVWKILVPYYENAKKITMEKHHEWDEEVIKISNGLTVLGVNQGKWVSKCGKNFNEKMIAVEIACSKHDIETIAQFTLTHYNQKAVYFYKISEEVHIYENPSSIN